MVLRAFGCTGPAVPIPGGEGRAWRAGDCIFKPVDDPSRYEWACECLAALKPEGFRFAAPLPDENGRYVQRGWAATSFEPGEHIAGRWEEKLTASRSFHAALKRVPHSAMPPARDRWSRAHAIAWQESSLPDGLTLNMVRAITGLFRNYIPLARGNEIIHADICGNILFHPDLLPCVIDFSPAYGPRAYADAILVADAVAWEGAPLELVDQLPLDESARQLLLRAVNFRLVTAALFAPGDAGYFEREYADFQPLIAHLT